MKNYCSFCFIIFSYFYSQKKVYYTEDFKELSTAEGPAYYSTYEMIKKALLFYWWNKTQLRSIFKFQKTYFKW
jgi:hypothetical protein